MSHDLETGSMTPNMQILTQLAKSKMHCATIGEESEYSGMSADKRPVQNFGTSKLRKSLKFSLLVEKYQLTPYIKRLIS